MEKRATERYAAEIETAVMAARCAGRAIMAAYDRAASIGAQAKRDGSPVTAADLASDQAIRMLLADRFPADAVLTEEGQDDLSRLFTARCWVVDPLDGTKQFLAHTDIFDVLIALVVAGEPVVGVVHHPPERPALSRRSRTRSLAGPRWRASALPLRTFSGRRPGADGKLDLVRHAGRAPDS